MIRKKSRKFQKRTKEEAQDEIIASVASRGNKQNPFITPKMERFIMLLTDFNDNRGICKKMESVPVSKTCVYVHWLRNPKFLEAYKEERERKLRLYATNVDKALMRKAKKGKAAMVKLFYQRTGELATEGGALLIDKASEITVNTNIPRPKED